MSGAQAVKPSEPQKGTQRPAGAKAGAESTESTETSNGAGSEGGRAYGRLTEGLRKNSSISIAAPVPSPVPAPPAHRARIAPAARPAAASPAPDLVRDGSRMQREKSPATGPQPGHGTGWPANTPPSLARGLPAPEQAVIDAALAILARRVSEPGAVAESPGAARELVRLHLAQCERERFGVLFLDAQHRALGFEVLFEGSLTATAVTPREVVRRALQLNAGAVILAHNHPSGLAQPSRADEYLTTTLKAALRLVDVQVLDHLVVGWPELYSMAEHGLMEPTPSYPPAAAPAARVRASARGKGEAQRRAGKGQAEPCGAL